MGCSTCLHKWDGDFGPECRRQPKQAVGMVWIGDKRMKTASREERVDPRNWHIVSVYPPADAGCGNYVHKL